jgi:hypothetical protein
LLASLIPRENSAAWLDECRGGGNKGDVCDWRTKRKEALLELEGIDGFAQNRVAKERLESLAVHDVCRCTQQFTDVEPKAGVLKDAYGAIRVKVYKYVNIAIPASLSSRHRSKDSSVTHTRPA